jgi:sugar-specific transcriptional regulator TrmB
MVSEEDNLQILKELGLSRSQGMVYIALLKLGPDSKATYISKLANVPRQDIYRVLEGLIQVGIVEKLISRPAKFRAIPPKKAISLLLEKKKNAFLKLEKVADSLSARLPENPNNQLDSIKKENTVLMIEKEAVYCKALELIEASRKRISLIIPWSETMLSLDLALNALNDACNRGVQVSWLANEPQETQQLPKGLRKLIKNPTFRFRFLSDTPTVKLGVYDDEPGVVIFHDDTFERSPTFVSNNAAILAMAEAYFETYWKSGKNIDRVKGATLDAAHRKSKRKRHQPIICNDFST